VILPNGRKVEEGLADTIQPEAKGRDEQNAENQQPP
jgi:hypothetical protein